MRTSLEKAFSLLEVIAASDEPVSLKALAERTGNNASTLSRVLSDLVQIGYVRKHGYRHFVLDLGLIPLGQKALSHFALPKIANPLIGETAAKVGVSGALAGIHHGRMVYLYRTNMGSEGATMAQAYEFPLHRSNAGLVILAGGPDGEARRLLEQSIREDAPAPASVRGEVSRLVEKIRSIRQDGYSILVEDAGWNVSFPLHHGLRVFAVSLHQQGKPPEKMDPVVLECSLLVRRIEQAAQAS